MSPPDGNSFSAVPTMSVDKNRGMLRVAGGPAGCGKSIKVLGLSD